MANVQRMTKRSPLDGAMVDVLRARRVEVIPNWADGEAIRPDAEAGARFRPEHGLGEATFLPLEPSGANRWGGAKRTER